MRGKSQSCLVFKREDDLYRNGPDERAQGVRHHGRQAQLRRRSSREITVFPVGFFTFIDFYESFQTDAQTAQRPQVQREMHCPGRRKRRQIEQQDYGKFVLQNQYFLQ